MTHFHIGFFEFLCFAMYYLIMKIVLVVFNIEARRLGWHIPAGVAGIFS